MNVVPGHLVLGTCGSGLSYGEDESLIERLLQQLQHLLPLSVLGQIGRSIGTVKRHSRMWVFFLSKEQRGRWKQSSE